MAQPARKGGLGLFRRRAARGFKVFLGPPTGNDDHCTGRGQSLRDAKFTLGIAGFPSGEAYKVGFSVPYARLPRMFVRQTIDLGGDTEKRAPRFVKCRSQTRRTDLKKFYATPWIPYSLDDANVASNVVRLGYLTVCRSSMPVRCWTAC
jgi:hypothetical protein